VDVLGISVLHPVGGEQITEARSNMSSVDGVVGRAVGGPGGLSGVGGSNSVDTGVGSEFGEHGSGLASFNVEDELLVHFLLMHGVDGALELIGIQVG